MAELLSFADRRLQAQVELCRSLSRCQERDDAVNVQREFTGRVTTDYLDEVNQLSEVFQRNIAALLAVGADLVGEMADKDRLMT